MVNRDSLGNTGTSDHAVQFLKLTHLQDVDDYGSPQINFPFNICEFPCILGKDRHVVSC